MQDRGASRARDPRRVRKTPNRNDVDAKARADQLVQQGMPYQMAMSVAHGRMDLNEALERMARRDRVNVLMERHDLSRALATQIALGQADLEVVLARRRLEQHRRDHRDRTCLVPGQPLALVLHDGRTLKGAVLSIDPYQFTFGSADQSETLHKLQVMYGYAPDQWKAVKKGVKTGDKKSAVEPPATRPQDRYSCSDKRLFSFQDRGAEVVATLIDGTVLRGVIEWFGRYEFGVRLKADASVTVFRHALRDLSAA